MKSSYDKCIKYINNHWKELTFFHPKDEKVHIGLPNKFIAPSYGSGIFESDQFYWDSYFIILGLVESNKVKLAKGMVENLVCLFNRFDIIPTRNKLYDLGTSQPPFLTSMALEVFKKTKDKKWLKNIAEVAEKELKDYWVDDKRVHRVYKGLSRYCGHLWVHSGAEQESGWDITSRFSEKCLDYLPVDLNSCLYKYEIDLAKIHEILGNKSKTRDYLKKSEKRKKLMTELMWDRRKGFFFDYNYKNKKQSSFYSLAGFYPLWAGLATKKQARRTMKKIRKFEYKGGLANTQKKGLSREYKQWDYPNGWPNQQWIVATGLSNYGFKEEAKRIAIKWLDLNKKVFQKTGKFWEKYNVVKYERGKDGRYPTQSGFGWTNGVFLRLVKDFDL